MDESESKQTSNTTPEAPIPPTLPEAQDPQDTTLFSPVKETDTPVEGGTTMMAGVSTMPVSTEAIANATLKAVEESKTAQELAQHPDFKAAKMGSQIKNAAEEKRTPPQP